MWAEWFRQNYRVFFLFALFLVLTAILSGEWDKNLDNARYLLALFAPRQLPHLIRFGEKFQRYGVELFLGIGIVMAIFVPIFFALLFFYAKLSLGKSVLFGAILGFTSAIPTIGGIITYFGGTMGALTLHATSTMRVEVAAASCP